MSVRAYILILAQAGRAGHVANEAAGIRGVTSSEGVTGPYDVVVRAEGSSLDDLNRQVTRELQSIEGVTRTLTCPVIRL